ncbi:hypothetical protein PV385_42980, partial [Streptomyces stelliscabiei]|nr:hypothetical protein [Streptomyces stelliscabiei]
PVVGRLAREMYVRESDGRAALARALAALESEDVDVLEIGLSRCTLDDVFLGLTGHAHRADHVDSAGRGNRADQADHADREITR